MKKIIKDAVSGNYILMTLTIIAVSLIIGSFFVPPLGVVDGSVVASVGEIFAFAALWVFATAIQKGVNASVTHNGTTISVEQKDENEES